MSTAVSTFGNFKAPLGAGQAFLFLSAIFLYRGGCWGLSQLHNSRVHSWTCHRLIAGPNVGFWRSATVLKGISAEGFTVTCFSRNIFYLCTFYLSIFRFSSFSFHLFLVISLSTLSTSQLYQLWCSVAILSA